MQLTLLPLRTTDSARELAWGKMAAGDDVRDSALRHLAFPIHIYGYINVILANIVIIQIDVVN